jgi:hypothetical protein
MDNKQIHNLETLLTKWVSYTMSSFRGINTVELFRNLQFAGKEGVESLQDEVRQAVYNLRDPEIARVFDTLCYPLDYDYLPCWVMRHRNGEKFEQEMNDILLYGQTYTVPSRETLTEMIEGFCALHGCLKKNGVELDLVPCFVAFLEKCLALSG